MPALVSVVIPNYNDRDNLALCLESLAAQDYPEVEVIVVDDGSSDGSPGMVRERFPRVKLIDRKVNQGFSAVVNAGIEASRGSLVALLNSDAEAGPEWVSELSGAAERNPDAGFFACKILFHKDRRTIDTFGDGFSAAGFGFKRGWGEDSDAHTEETEVFGACGGAAAYRRAMLDDIKLSGEYFDVGFFAFAEDLDVSLRARLMGYKCVAVPGAVVYHKVRGAWGRKSERVAFLSHRNFILCVMKCFPASLILRNLHRMLCYYGLAAVADLVKNRRLLYLRGYIAAVAMLPSILRKRKLIQASRRIGPGRLQAMLEKKWFSVWLKLHRMNRAVFKRGL